MVGVGAILYSVVKGLSSCILPYIKLTIIIRNLVLQMDFMHVITNCVRTGHMYAAKKL